MGWAAKWFRGLLGLKKPDSVSPATAATKQSKEKRRWSFVKSYREKDHNPHHLHHHTTTKTGEYHNFDVSVRSSGHVIGVDPGKHAIAVSAATAAVAEAATAVVRLTSRSQCTGTAAETAAHVSAGSRISEEWAAIKIQAAFRGCLARRALRALKGLVKLQALVRGHIERKRTAEWVQKMQVFVRAQARARVARAQILQTSYSSSKPLNIHPTGPATPDKVENLTRLKSLKHDQSLVPKRTGLKSHVHINGNQERLSRSDSRVDEQSWNRQRSRTLTTDDEKSVRVPELDSGKPHFREKRRNLFHSTYSNQHSRSLATTHQSGQSSSSGEVQFYSSVKMDEIESPLRPSDNSPQFYSASSIDGGSKTSPLTPSKSVGSRSYTSAYSDHPNYMAFTESSKAKVRSLSAPKQRPRYERSSSSNGYYLHRSDEFRLAAQTASSLHTSFTRKDYPGSGRLDKLGLPVGYRY